MEKLFLNVSQRPFTRIPVTQMSNTSERNAKTNLIAAVNVYFQQDSEILQYKMVAHFTPKAKSRQATMILSQTLSL